MTLFLSLPYTYSPLSSSLSLSFFTEFVVPAQLCSSNRTFSFFLSLFDSMNRMALCRLILLFFALSFLVSSLDASEGDADLIYMACLKECEKSGCVGERCFQHCKFSSDGKPIEPLYQKWKQWDCRTDCRYHCMLAREEQREKLGDKPVKYHGKWPFRRVYGIQEPVAVAFSALSLAIQFHVEKLDYSSAVVLVGFSLILAILRAFKVRDEASRVMAAAPLIAFVTTHILYLNFYKLDYGLYMKACMKMGVVQLLFWGVWAGVTSHPSRWKVWLFVVGGSLAVLLEIYDFPTYRGFVDAHALWQAASIPLTFSGAL